MKKVKDMIKKNTAPKQTFGTDPKDPWSAKYDITENVMLDRFLRSRGINPETVEKNKKSAWARSDAFAKWSRDHAGVMFREQTLATKVKTLLGKNKESPKVSRTKLHPAEKSERSAASELSHRAHTQHQVKTPHPERRYVGEENEQEKVSEDLRQWFKQKWVRMDTKGNIKGQCAREKGEGKPKCLPQAKAQALGKDKRAAAARRKRREDPNPERRGKAINVRTEDVDFDRIDEISAQTKKSYVQKAKQVIKDVKPYTRGEYGDLAKRLIARRKKGIAMATKESVGDPQAAVNADGLNTQMDLMRSERKSMMKKKVVKEDLYDHEKADKSVATYGKKPKFDKTDPKESQGENKPTASAVLSGGKTMTGQKRDTVEIDPMMRVRPGQPDPTKKKDDKDKKKEEKK